jgi:hypothetical protein
MPAQATAGFRWTSLSPPTISRGEATNTQGGQYRKAWRLDVPQEANSHDKQPI